MRAVLLLVAVLSPLACHASVQSYTALAVGDGVVPSYATTPLYRHFGQSVGTLGDVDGDGVADFAVGWDNTGLLSGSVYVFFMNTDGTVRSSTFIPQVSVAPLPSSFGTAVIGIGDYNRDGTPDMAVGARNDVIYGLQGEIPTPTGAVYVLFLNSTGSPIPNDGQAVNNGFIKQIMPSPFSQFGSSIAQMTNNVLAVGAPAATGLGIGPLQSSVSNGSVFFIGLQGNGSVVATFSVELGGSQGNGPPLSRSYEFGSAVADIGDVTGDGIKDIAVGAPGAEGTGHVYLIALTSSYAMKSYSRVSPRDISGVDGSEWGAGLAAGSQPSTLWVGGLRTEAETFSNGNNGNLFLLTLTSDAGVPRYQGAQVLDTDTLDLSAGYNTVEADGLSGVQINTNSFANGIALLPDVNGDGVDELVVANAMLEATGGTGQVFVYTQYTVRGTRKHSSDDNALSESQIAGVAAAAFFGSILLVVSLSFLVFGARRPEQLSQPLLNPAGEDGVADDGERV